MSRIEIYNQAKGIADLAKDLDCRASSDQPHDSSYYYDKLGVRVQITDSWAGRYGCSSTHGWADVMTREFTKQIEVDTRLLIHNMAVRLEAEAQALRLKAVDEARAILEALP
jgi:hypothetical protein